MCGGLIGGKRYQQRADWPRGDRETEYTGPPFLHGRFQFLPPKVGNDLQAPMGDRSARKFKVVLLGEGACVLRICAASLYV